MNSDVNSEIVYVNHQGNNSTIIKEIIGEMKYHFNKSEHKNGASNVETDESDNVDMEIDNTQVENEKQRGQKSENLKLKDKTDVDSHLFKKPSDESPMQNTKRLSPGKRSQQQKDNKEIILRSSRRRSKDLSSSILQNAIARKEKSYNESIKPQRLSRQLKTTRRHAENVDNDLQRLTPLNSDSDESSSNLSGTKKRRKAGKVTGTKDKIVKDDIGSDSLESTSDDSEHLNVNKDVDCVDKCNTEDKVTNRNISESVSRLCLCKQNTNLFADVKENEILYCSAIDSIEDKHIGCSKIANVKTVPLLRPSRRVPYQILCDWHKNRLIRHNCCATCGVFCTQGRFVECEAKHHYHRKCQILMSNSEFCPHCGILSPSKDVVIRLHSDKKPVFLPSQKPQYPTAKMSFLPVDQHKISTCPSFALLLPETVKILSQFDVNGQHFTGNDLIEAIRDENEIKIATIIASNNVDLHFKIADFNDGTLLHYAAFKGLLMICHLLSSAHFELDQLDKEQNTPLMLAISANKNDVVRYLLSAGANISIKGTDGMTPLHMAAKCGNLDALKCILNSVTLPNFVNCRDDGGWTPLVWACEHGHIDVVSYLISNGANPHLRDVEYNEALHWAAFSGSSDVLAMLLNAGCDVNTVNVQGETPLHIAAREDRSNCIIVLLARGADVSITNKNNETPLDYVSVGGKTYNVLLLNLKLQSVMGSNGMRLNTILSNDISRGRESNPVQCVNTVDGDPEPNDFVYMTKNCLTVDNLKIDRNLSRMSSCACTDNCKTDSCSCTSRSRKCWYDEEDRLAKDFNFDDAPTIFECNEACRCNAITCKNRVVQRGLTQRFQIFKTEEKGWGLKTLRSIPKGTFVCEYIGEILTDNEADGREDDSFLFSLGSGVDTSDRNFQDSESFSVDAKRYGNISRFINHSCAANLHPIKLFVDHQDLRLPRIALFARRDILAEEELSFDYGSRFWLVKSKYYSCKCKASECKFANREIEEDNASKSVSVQEDS